MTLPRSAYVKDGQEGVFHCYTRCVRRAFLCGRDPVTQRDYSYRKTWIVDRLRQLAAIFAIEVCAYAILENHDHTVLRTRPDIVVSWSDREVATRWLTLFPVYIRKKDKAQAPTDEQISALANNVERIAILRIRLSSISWFMGRLNEFVARAANKEDKVKGRFWESRFKCTPLLDVAAIVACMAYVDLNPIRAGLAATPEDSDFTSIQERIRVWRQEMTIQNSITRQDAQESVEAIGSSSFVCGQIHSDALATPDKWLCPIQSAIQRRGILEMTEAEYFSLVDLSGRILRSGKRGAIDAELDPILLRIGIKPDAWMDTVSHFESRFHLAAGLLSSLRNFANKIGRHWVAGLSSARVAFASSPSQLVRSNNRSVWTP
jgi:REP element-mobilizing transposase RayT